MDLNLKYTGTLMLKNWKTTNKVKEDDEVLTGYCSFEGLVPAAMFGTLTGLPHKEYAGLFWSEDGQVRLPSMKSIPFNVVADGHIVDFKSGLGYREEDSTIRGFSLAAAYGHQWLMEIEILIRPKTPAVTGRFAAKEGHEVELVVEGRRTDDMVDGISDD